MPGSQLSLETFCVSRLKVLADPTRLGVMGLLLGGPKHVGEMNVTLGMDQLLSHHLHALRKAELVEAGA